MTKRVTRWALWRMVTCCIDFFPPHRTTCLSFGIRFTRAFHIHPTLCVNTCLRSKFLSSLHTQLLERLFCSYEQLLSSLLVALSGTLKVEKAIGFLGASVFYLVIQCRKLSEGMLETRLSFFKSPLGLPDAALQALTNGGQLAVLAGLLKLHGLIEVELRLFRVASKKVRFRSLHQQVGEDH